MEIAARARALCVLACAVAAVSAASVATSSSTSSRASTPGVVEVTPMRSIRDSPAASESERGASSGLPSELLTRSR